MKQVFSLSENWQMRKADSQDEWLTTSVPISVQEVLWTNDLLDKTALETGEGASCAWVSESDWVFRTTFAKPETNGKYYLSFAGLDTIADVSLNGTVIYQSRSMFLPAKVEITEHILEENELSIYFTSPKDFVAKKKTARLRKTPADFTQHGGAVPYFTPIGICGDITLSCVPEGEITYLDIDTRFTMDYSRAMITIQPEYNSDIVPTYESFVLTELVDENGMVVSSGRGALGKPILMTLANPNLWWPRNYGPQYMYTLRTRLYIMQVLADTDERQIGLRDLRTAGTLKFTCNGVPIRMWGSAITPMWGPSHRYMKERTDRLIDYAVEANFNLMRVWGPSQQYDNAMYEAFDRLGILVWHDFPYVGAFQPEDTAFVSLCLAEVEALIKRLKHHPSILLWCGCNECFYMHHLMHHTEPQRKGAVMFEEKFKALTTKLDPLRFYTPSSPYGGENPNDALVDTHGSRAARSFVPGEKYANFFSENIRTFVPELSSLERFIPADQLWPDDWNSQCVHGDKAIIPPAWEARTINRWQLKIGPAEDYYDAQNPYELTYKINQATAEDLREVLNANRRGKSASNQNGPYRTNAMVSWKFCSPWPQIYCAHIDYYLEPGRSYYMMRRCYAPVTAHINIEDDHLNVWGVNDTRNDFVGTVEIGVHDFTYDIMHETVTYPVAILAVQSIVITNLDKIDRIRRSSVVSLKLKDADGNVIARDFQYLRKERYLDFAKANLTLTACEGGVLVHAEDFARSVELTGDADGDTFGWFFADNYFDLMPGETLFVPILGKHDAGTIHAKVHYHPEVTSIDWQR